MLGLLPKERKRGNPNLEDFFSIFLFIKSAVTKLSWSLAVFDRIST